VTRTRAEFERLWEGIPPVTDARRVGRATCAYAADFAVWASALLEDVAGNPTPGRVNRAKLELQARFFTLRETAPEAHRTNLAAGRHRCLWHVYEETLVALSACWPHAIPVTEPTTTEEPAEPVIPPDAVTLGTDVHTGQPVTLTEEERTRHLTVLGRTGTGKSNFMLHLIRQDMVAGRGLCLLDPQGKLAEAVLAHVPPAREGDVILLDLADSDYPFGLNLFAPPDTPDAAERARQIAAVPDIFRRVWGESWGILVQTWLTVIAHTLRDCGHGTLVEAPRLFTDPAYRAAVLPHVQNRFARSHWEQQTRSRGGTSDDPGSTLRRLGLLLSNDLLVNIVGQERTTLDFDRVIRERQILVVKLPVLAVGEETVDLVGTILVHQFLAAARRHCHGAAPFFLYADEVQRFATPDFARLINETRQYAIGVTVATQQLDALDDPLVRAAVLATGSLVVFQPTGDDAARVARELTVLPAPLPVAPPFDVYQTICDHPKTHTAAYWAMPASYRERYEMYREGGGARPSTPSLNRYLIARMTGTAARWSPAAADLMAAGFRDTAAFRAVVASWCECGGALPPFGEGSGEAALVGWLVSLQRFGDAVARHPVPVPGDDPPSRAAIATALTRMEQTVGRGAMICRVPGGEHLVRVPQVDGPNDTARSQARRARIQARSRRDYCRPGPRWKRRCGRATGNCRWHPPRRRIPPRRPAAREPPSRVRRRLHRRHRPRGGGRACRSMPMPHSGIDRVRCGLRRKRTLTGPVPHLLG